MSLKPSDPPLRIEPRVSHYLALGLLLVHAAGIVALASLTLPMWIVLAATLAVCASLYYQLALHVLGRTPRSILHMVLESDGEWTVMSGSGSVYSARLLSSSLIHPLMMVLNFDVSKIGRRSVVLLPDSLSPQLYRQLLVRLRLTRDSTR